MTTDLKTLDEKTMAAPKSRIGTAENASSFVIKIVAADLLRSQRRVKIKGQIDGNAPYNQGELRTKGMANNTNLNFRQAGGIINAYKTPYYDLLVEVPLLANIQTAFGKPEEQVMWSGIISEEFHRMVTDWEDWDFVSQFHQFEMLVHGVGVMFFRDAVDWRPNAAKCADVLVQDSAPSKVSELDAIVILKSYTAPELYRYIIDKRKAEDVGWDVPAVEQAIIESKYRGNQPIGTDQMEWYQQKFKNADQYYGSYECDKIQTGTLLVREFNGKISQHIVRADRSTESFLYSKLDRFSEMSEVVVPFFYDIGDGTWHSINGLGKEIYAYARIFDMLRCREIDGAMIAASVMLQPKTASTVTRQQLMDIGNLSILPPDVTLVPTNIGQGIEATSNVRRDMEGGLDRNIGLIGRLPGTIDPRKGQKQALAEMAQAAQIGKGAINRYYAALDKLYAIMYRRATNQNLKQGMPGAKEALEFQRRCLRRGVPAQALVDNDSVHSYRSVGAGSIANAMAATQAIIENAGMYPEEGKDVAIRLWLSRTAGTQTMRAIMGPQRIQTRTSDDSIAALENNALRTGGQVVIDIQQSHVKHLEWHLNDAEAHQAEAQQQGLDVGTLQSLFVHLDATGKHCLEHLKAIQNDPIRATEFKALLKRWQSLAKAQDQVQQQLEEAMQAQEQAAQEQPQNDPMEILKLLDYGKMPESSKVQIENLLGVPRAEGDVSVPGQNVQLKAASTALKASGQQQKAAVENVRLSKELAEPKTAA